MQDAIDHISNNDPVLAWVISKYGLCDITPNTNYYQELVDAIISQQLSVKAAQTIERRFCELFGSTDFPPPEKIMERNIEELRTAGLSRGKATYMLDLAQHVVDGRVRFDHLSELPNQEIINELTDVKGIGEWTAHMFLIFCMGRLDVLAHGDLGIRNGIQKLYGIDHTPKSEDVKNLAKMNNWHPYESVACWYVWQSLDNKPNN